MWSNIFKPRQSVLTKLLSQPLVWLMAVAILLAIALRLYNLSAIPAGMHQDEAWFAYNATLLKATAANIYGERWPLTVDMWGDHVSSFHSFAIVPFISLFGTSYAAFRSTFVAASLACMALSGWLLYRLTKQPWVAAGATFLFATSQWNIIMTRASSTVILDSLAMLLLAVVWYEGLRWWATLKKVTNSQQVKLGAWLLLSYGLTVLCYFTYFTSRLVVPFVLVGLVAFAWHVDRLPLKRALLASLVLVAYLIFPFAVMLQTPYALGRYQETTIINNDYVKNQIFLDISRSGQAHIPAWLTRMVYNKVTENVVAVAHQFTTFFSPSVVLFQTNKPARYWVPQAGVVNWVEYGGLVLAAAALLLVPALSKPDARLKASSFLLLLLVGATLAPTSLTSDDFPNFQRGVFVTPYWQMAAALGWFIAWQTCTVHCRNWPRLVRQFLPALFVVGLGLGVLSSLFPFTIAYFGHTKYANVFNRSRAGEELGKWINANAHDATLLMDHDEANFVYAYLYAGENVLDIGVEKTEKYFLKTPQFRIGSRLFVHHLCQREDLGQLIANDQPQFVIVKTYPPYDTCRLPSYYEFIHSTRFDDGTVGFEIYRRNEKVYQYQLQQSQTLSP